jgi:hypothetical protein
MELLKKIRNTASQSDSLYNYFDELVMMELLVEKNNPAQTLTFGSLLDSKENNSYLNFI